MQKNTKSKGDAKAFFTRILKPIFITLGFLAFGAGSLGVFLPVLPTTPFYLLAVFCFTRGSKRFYNRFTGTKLYQKHLEKFMRTRAMTMRAKLLLCIPVSGMLLTMFCFAPSWHMRGLVLAAALLKWWYFLFRIRTLSP
ncbi:MAG: YbaN family protein [Oscillospiraceae bacterium]|jgi:uncharacterized membrane protein YbaN (DUF454 family)|nr:YbaN family protein [Oscillospiraceae bacterium]